jgi:ATP-binding cassette subfamily F protein uup
MFTKPGNVLVMDEPTNDLDIETLELLESLLVEYEGTLLLVSHDRAFVNNVVTSTLAYEGEGAWKEYPGGYDDWLEQRKKTEVKEKKSATKGSGKRKSPLNGKEKRELDAMPKRIEELEAELDAFGEKMSAPDFYQKPQDEQQPIINRSEAIPLEMDDLFLRWGVLEVRLKD